MSKEHFVYYDFSKIMSFDAIFNFIIGGRGIGKTYGAIKKEIKKSIRDGTHFIYLRRYKEELAYAKSTFFAEMSGVFQDVEFRITGHIGEYRPRGSKEWKTLVYFFALSQSQKIKSGALPLVRSIIYDEFIIEKSRTPYLPNEARAFLGFYSTVDRSRDNTKVFFLANSVSIMNPYFLEFNINASNTGISRYADGFIAIDIVDDETFSDQVKATRFGKFVESTEFGDYAIMNQFHDNDNRLLGKKASSAIYMLSLKVPNGEFSVWHDFKANEFHCQQHQPAKPLWHTTDPTRVADDCLLIDRKNRLFDIMRRAFRQGRMYFDSPVSRNALTDIFKV